MSTQKLRMLLFWLGEPRYVYLAILYVLFGIALIYCFGASERSIHLVSGGLQVLGIGTAVWGISVTRKQFGHPSVLKLVAAWFRRCPLIRRSIYLETDGINVGVSVLGGRLTSVFTPKPNASLEVRVKAIELGMNTIQQRIGNAETQIDNEMSKTHGKITEEAKKREKADRDTMLALEATSTGGIYISAIGALWLFVGVVLSTVSPELSSWSG